MRKIALVALALLLVPAGLASAETKPKATHPPVVKHHMDKSRIGRHVKPHHPRAQHAKNNHPKAFHPTNPHLAEVHPHKAKDTNAGHQASKAALKASKPHRKFHLF